MVIRYNGGGGDGGGENGGVWGGLIFEGYGLVGILISRVVVYIVGFLFWRYRFCFR